VRRAAEAPASGDVGDPQVTEPDVGQIVAAPAQALLADPPAEREALASEQPVQLANRHVASGRHDLGRQRGFAQMREREILEQAGRSPAARVQAILVSRRRAQRADRQVEPRVDERSRLGVAARAIG
jgi:hypothetical protein